MADNDDAGRWVQVGALWEGPKGLTGTVSLGLLGEVKVIVRLNNSPNPQAPKFNIIARSNELPLPPKQTRRHDELPGPTYGSKKANREPPAVVKAAQQELRADDDDDIPF